jgi:Anaerobic c4-dicarboxylate membrane transporter
LNDARIEGGLLGSKEVPAGASCYGVHVFRAHESLMASPTTVSSLQQTVRDKVRETADLSAVLAGDARRLPSRWPWSWVRSLLESGAARPSALQVASAYSCLRFSGSNPAKCRGRVPIIMSVIVAIAAMQVAGGMDYFVDLADRILRRPWQSASRLAALAAFPAVSALFILPTYPTLLAAVQMDDTGTTQIGKGVFNHPFLVPGLINITIAVALGFLSAR